MRRSRQESLLAKADQIVRPTDIIKVERSLNTLGFFTPGTERPIIDKKVKIRVQEASGDKRIEVHAEIIATRFGLPITADQDKYYAFCNIMEQYREKHQTVENPIAFASAEMIKLLGLTKCRDIYEDISEWLDRMTFTGIRAQGTILMPKRKMQTVDRFTVFSRAVTAGQELPSGAIADRNFVWLSDWQLENINAAYTMPIDFELYKSLRYNVAKALLPLLQNWFYASRSSLSSEVHKNYQDLCELLSIKRYNQESRIRTVLGKSLDELSEKGFLSNWRLDRMAEGEEYKLVLQPGHRYLSASRQRHLDRRGSDSFQLVGSLEREFLDSMLQRGITEHTAQQLLEQFSDPGKGIDLLEWGDEIIRQDPRRWSNPPGMYVHLLQKQYELPPSFVPCRKWKALAAAQQERSSHLQRSQQLEEDYQTYRLNQADQHIFTSEGERHWRNISDRIYKQIVAQFPRANVNGLRESAEASARREIANSLDLLSFDEFCQRRQATLFQ